MPDLFLSIVIPAFNEAERLGSSLERIKKYLDSKTFAAEVIVVDDGSTDDLDGLLRASRDKFPALQLIRNEQNRGKGFSVRRGVLASRGRFVVFTDADLSAPIEETDMLLEQLERAQADAAVGSRALRRELIGVHQPRVREIGGQIFNKLIRFATGLKIQDTQCGLKLFRAASTRRAFELQRSERFSFDFELLFLIQRLGGKIVEVPVRWDNNPATKVRVLRDAGHAILDLIALRWRAATGKYSSN